jgi:3-hydroxybutyryl-CoA dehydrogenase
MGHGIAQVSAMADNNVTIRDIETELIENGIDAIEENLQGGVERDKLTTDEKKATLDRLSGTTDLAAACEGADLVIEAVPEEMDIKQSTFEDVEAEVDEECVIATNTSSLSVTEIASALDTPERAIGLHFFNPVHIMPLVEVIHGDRTDEEIREFAVDFVQDIDKTAIECADAPGFASSRLGVALGLEAMRMVEEGVASPTDIDDAMELGYNHPMGPLELTDVVGLDVRLDILAYLRAELGERFRPPQVLKRKVRAGKLGQKSGEGFYVWEDGEIVGVSGEGE